MTFFWGLSRVLVAKCSLPAGLFLFFFFFLFPSFFLSFFWGGEKSKRNTCFSNGLRSGSMLGCVGCEHLKEPFLWFLVASSSCFPALLVAWVGLLFPPSSRARRGNVFFFGHQSKASEGQLVIQTLVARAARSSRGTRETSLPTPPGSAASTMHVLPRRQAASGGVDVGRACLIFVGGVGLGRPKGKSNQCSRRVLGVCILGHPFGWFF